MPAHVIRMPNQISSNTGSGGINICCCRICTCVNLEFLTTKNGLFKLSEVILGSLCQTLLIRFGLPYANDIGQAFISFLTTVASCLTTASILLLCYVVSSKSFQLIRQSLFEVVFNAVSCFFYLSASSYMGFAVNVWLYPRFVIQSGYMAYPAMMAAYYVGGLVGIIHGVDAYWAYRYFRGYR
ncbi:hypothetical protein HA402_010629 [Bradysia odoriphaga]|nr:hypothetical protein HA402_010629 [Bradysia odoriphaga]